MKRCGRLLALALLLAVFFSACASSSPSLMEQTQDPAVSGVDQVSSGAQLALVNSEEMLASTFGQDAWSTISRFAGESGLSSASYTTLPQDRGAVSSAVELAAKSGAELVLMMDAGVTQAVVPVLYQYPDLRFVLLHAPYGQTLPANAVALRFSPEQAGWLAGYALGCAGMVDYAYVAAEDELSQRTLLGYVLGLEDALAQMAPPGDASQEEPPLATPLRGVLLPEELPEEEQAGQLEQLFGRRGEEQIIPPQVAFVATESLQLAVLKLAGTFGVAGVEITPWPQASALASVTFDARALLYQVLESWAEDRFLEGGEVVGNIAAGDILLNVQEAEENEAVQKGAQAAAAYFTENGIERQLAQIIVSGETGALPLPEELALSHLVCVPPGGPPEAASNVESMLDEILSSSSLPAA